MDLSELAKRVRSAVAEAKAPPPPGGSKPVVWPTDLLDEEGWSLLWQVVRQIRERAPKTFVRFPELTLGLRVADELGENPSLDFDALLARLGDAAEEYGPRVVSTSICNVVMASSAVRLAHDAVLVRAFADKDAPQQDEDIAADFDIEGWLGARMSRPLRFVDLRERYDTTRTAALLTVEQGVPPLALARARARAQYAIAMWTVLAPPEGRKVLPDLGMWVPHPLAHCPQRHRSLTPLEGSAPRPREEGGGYNEFGMFVLPADDELRLPFEAMAYTDRRGAQAVLSASLHLMGGGRASRLQTSERARALMAAVESLGEQPSGKNARRRFMRLMQRYGTDHAMEARGWGPEQISEALERIVKARNIATHGSDAVLLDVGYPADAVRKLRFGEALGTELAAGSIQSDLPALVHVVGRTLDSTIRELAADGWEDKAYMSYFL